jgi:hypothetical protein
MDQRLFNLKHYLQLKEMFSIKPNSQYTERYHSTVSCKLNTEDLI